MKPAIKTPGEPKPSTKIFLNQIFLFKNITKKKIPEDLCTKITCPKIPKDSPNSFFYWCSYPLQYLNKIQQCNNCSESLHYSTLISRVLARENSSFDIYTKQISKGKELREEKDSDWWELDIKQMEIAVQCFKDEIYSYIYSKLCWLHKMF